MPQVVDTRQLTFMIEIHNRPAAGPLDGKAVNDSAIENPYTDNSLFMVGASAFRMGDVKTLDKCVSQLGSGGKPEPPEGVQRQAGRLVVLDVEMPGPRRLPARPVPVLPASRAPELSQSPPPPLRPGDLPRTEKPGDRSGFLPCGRCPG